jgi:hypothetical protein
MSKEINYEKLRSVIRKKLQMLTYLYAHGEVMPFMYNTLKVLLNDLYYTTNPELITHKVQYYNSLIQQLGSNKARKALYIDITEIKQT